MHRTVIKRLATCSATSSIRQLRIVRVNSGCSVGITEFDHTIPVLFGPLDDHLARTDQPLGYRSTGIYRHISKFLECSRNNQRRGLTQCPQRQSQFFTIFRKKATTVGFGRRHPQKEIAVAKP